MITIKFYKHSKKKINNSIYSIVVISNKFKPSSGKMIEKIGYYHFVPNN